MLGDYLGDGCWWWVVMELCVGSWVMMGCRGGQVFWGRRANTGVCPYIPSMSVTCYLLPITYYLVSPPAWR